MEEVPMKNIYSALAKAQAEVKAAGKSGENKFDHYTYAMLVDFWEVSQKPLADNGLALTLTVSKLTRLPDRATAKGGSERVVELELTGILTHTSGESMKFVSYGEGQDRSDKAIYKAHTGARKYLIAGILNIPTSDDPEKDSDKERGEGDKSPTSPPKTTPPPSRPTTEAGGGKVTKEDYNTINALVKANSISAAKMSTYIKKAFSVAKLMELTKAQFNVLKKTIEDKPHVIDPGEDAIS